MAPSAARVIARAACSRVVPWVGLQDRYITCLLAIDKLGYNRCLRGHHVRWNTSGLAEQYTGKVGCGLAGPHPRETFCSAAACCCNNADEIEITNTTLESIFMTFWP